MTTQELFDLTAENITTKIQNSFGLTKFAYKRAKFEGWLKVELIDALVQQEIDKVLPEVGFVDVSFENVGIELKTINTNIRYPNVLNMARPITENVNGIKRDIEKLRATDFLHKFVVFIVFPIEHENANWQIQLQRLAGNVEGFLYKEFKFQNDISGVIYYARVK